MITLLIQIREELLRGDRPEVASVNDERDKVARSVILAYAIDRRGIGTGRVGVNLNLMVDQVDDPVDRHGGGGVDPGLDTIGRATAMNRRLRSPAPCRPEPGWRAR